MTSAISRIIQNSAADSKEMLYELAREMNTQIGVKAVYVARSGEILPLCTDGEQLFNVNEKEGETVADVELTEQLKNVYDARINVELEAYHTAEGADPAGYKALIIPVKCRGDNMGALIIYKKCDSYNEDEIILTEYFSTFFAIIVKQGQNEILAEKTRDIAIVKSAISTLSYSEYEAIVHIFEELNNKEGLLVASKIADRVGITRSVIVNALRKFESAGVIETRSLGMKGTFIKVLNPYLVPELENSR